MNIVLCGMMGCGKTTVAAAIAKKYNLATVDTDEVIVSRYGSIDKIFKDFGEQYFRDLEAKVTAEVAQSYKDAVIALGGGCVLREENVNNLKKSGKIFYLRTKPQTIIQRIKGDTTRPLLAGGLEERVYSILAARAHIYESVADVVVDTDGLTAEELARIIRDNIR